jgi:hypothetical protein
MGQSTSKKSDNNLNSSKVKKDAFKNKLHKRNRTQKNISNSKLEICPNPKFFKRTEEKEGNDPFGINEFDSEEEFRKTAADSFCGDEEEDGAVCERSFSKKGNKSFIYDKDPNKCRKSYISKLIAKNMWGPIGKEKTHNSIIIFDWDDTLMCTTYLTPGGIFNPKMTISNEDFDKISLIDKYSYEILKKSIEAADTYIVTNAALGWVEFSAKKFFPLTHSLLKKVKIISARKLFEQFYPFDSKMWKMHTFAEFAKIYHKDLLTNLLVIGDSPSEMEAGIFLKSKFKNCLLKTVKFRELPTLNSLLKELVLLNEEFANIFKLVENASINVGNKS